MNITEEQNETVVHFGRILSERELALMEICLAFFQSDTHPHNALDKEKLAGHGKLINTNG